MNTYTIQRELPLVDCTFSKMYDENGAYVCDFLEPPKPFAADTYIVRPYLSPDHGMAVPRYDDIPGHTEIEQHWGNEELDTEDCQLAGTDRGHMVVGSTNYDAILHSRQTFVALMQRYGFTDYHLDDQGKVATSLTTQAALDAWIAVHPECAAWTIEVLDAPALATS